MNPRFILGKEYFFLVIAFFSYELKNIGVSLIKTLYLRMDATLREITSLMKEVNPDARRKGTIFDFSLVAPNMGPGLPNTFRMRHIGATTAGVKGTDDTKTLSQCRYVYVVNNY